MTARALPNGLPSRARLPSTDTASPVFIVLRVQPARISALGFPISIAQLVTFPVFSSVTSIYKKVCGFAHETFVTTPAILNGLVTSNSAEHEWCAATGAI